MDIYHQIVSDLGLLNTLISNSKHHSLIHDIINSLENDWKINSHDFEQFLSIFGEYLKGSTNQQSLVFTFFSIFLKLIEVFSFLKYHNKVLLLLPA